MPLRIAIHGAAGRMGQRLIALAAADNDLVLAAAIDVAKQGEDAGQVAGLKSLGVPISAEIDAEVDVVIDFSVPAAAFGYDVIALGINNKNMPALADLDIHDRLSQAAGAFLWDAKIKSPHNFVRSIQNWFVSRQIPSVYHVRPAVESLAL